MGYRGEFIDIPLGLGGLDGNENFYQIPLSRLSVARNIIFRNDSILKAPGFSALDETGVGTGSTLLGGHDWRPSSSLQFQVTAWDNGDLYKSNASDIDAETLASGLTFTHPVYFVTGGHTALAENRKLFVFSKNVKPMQIDGISGTATDLTNDSIDWGTNYPESAIYHDARLYAFGLDNAPHTYYISALRDHGDFTLEEGSRVFSVFPGEGERISGMVSYSGTLLYVFKFPYGIYKIDTSNVSGYSLPAQRVRDDIGACSPRAVIKVGADVFFVSSNGRLYSLASLTDTSDARDADVTARFNLADYIDDNLDKTRLDWVKLQYNEKTKELYYFFTSKSGSGDANDTGLIFNLENQQTTKISIYDQGEYFNDCWRFIDNDQNVNVLIGGVDGKIYTMDSGTNNVNGEAYNAEFSLPETDLRFVDSRLQGTRKRFDMIELTVVPTGDYDINITFTVDGKESLTRTVNLSSDESVYDTAVFDSDKYAGSRILKKRIPVNVWGETLGITFSNNGLNEDFRVINARIYYKRAGTVYESA